MKKWNKKKEVRDGRYIIERVTDTEHTEWVSTIVVVPEKEDSIRLCGDMRAANTAIRRTRHPIPTVKDVSLELIIIIYLSFIHNIH